MTAVHGNNEIIIDKAYIQGEKLAQQPPASVHLTKALLKMPISQDIADTMSEERKHFSERLHSGECDEAFTAFF
jgi:enoyl-CoA hydratase/carnithine racemase